MILYREPYVMFDEEDDSGGGGSDKETTDQIAKDIKNEMNELFGALGAGTSTPDVKKVDEIELDLDMQDGEKEKKDEEGEETTVTVKDEEEVKAEETKESDDEETEKPAKESEIDKIREDFNTFAQAQLTRAGITVDDALTQTDISPAKKKEEPTATQAEPKLVDVKPIEMSDELFEKLREDKETFIGFLNDREKVLVASIKEQVLLESLPTNKKFIESYVSSMSSVRDFYDNNPLLKKHRSTVGLISTMIMQENPTLTRQESFDKTEKEAYRLLRLTKGTQPPENGAALGKVPGFAKGTGTRRGKPGEKVYKNQMQKDLAEMTPRR